MSIIDNFFYTFTIVLKLLILYFIIQIGFLYIFICWKEEFMKNVFSGYAQIYACMLCVFNCTLQEELFKE